MAPLPPHTLPLQFEHIVFIDLSVIDQGIALMKVYAYYLYPLILFDDRGITVGNQLILHRLGVFTL